MNSSMVFLLIAVVVIGILVFVGISMVQKRKHSFNKEKYQGHWLDIENAFKRNNPTTYNRAVMEADKLLDHAMQEMGIRGNTMGERLKRSGGRFSDINKIWTAHKMRNKIVHELDYHVSYAQAQMALRIFRNALKELGAI